MSYENPITVIDRESGQIWANAISGVSKSIADGIEKANKNMSLKQKTAQAELTAQSEYIIKNQAAFNAQAAKNGINNPSLFAAGKRVIDSMAEANMQVKNAKTKEAQQIALEKYSTIQKSYQNLVAGISAGGEADKTYKQDRIGTGIKGWKAPGKQGGMSVVGSDTQSFIKRMNVRVGLGQGATEEYIDNGDGTWNLQYSGGSYGDEIVSVPMSQSLTYDAGLVPDVDAEIMAVFDKPSGENEDGTQFSILNEKGKYSEEYLDFGNSFVENGKVGSDGSYVSSTIVPANTAKIIGAAVGGLQNKAKSYLADYNSANKIWMEILGNEEPLGRSGVGVSDQDQVRFTESFVNYGRKKLPAFNVKDQKENIDYSRRLSTRIKQIEETTPKKEDKTKEVASTLVKDLVGDTESFLTRYFEEDDFTMTEGPGAKGFTIKYVNKSGEVSNYTYDLTNPSDIERFFREELEKKLGTASQKSKILNEITEMSKVNKASAQTSELNAGDLLKKYSN